MAIIPFILISHNKKRGSVTEKDKDMDHEGPYPQAGVSSSRNIINAITIVLLIQ